MSNKKLINLLESFEVSSLREFEYQMKYNDNKKLLEIFLFFKGIVLNGERQDRLNSRLDTGYSKSHQKVLVTELTQKAEDFYVCQSLGQFKNYKSLLIRKTASLSSAEKVLEQELNAARKSISKQLVHSDDLIFNYQLEKDFQNFSITKGHHKNSFNDKLTSVYELDKFYWTQRVKLIMDVVSLQIRQPTIQLKDIPQFEETKSVIYSDYLEEDILFKLYKTALKLLLDTADNYDKLSKLLKDNIDRISKKDLEYIYAVLINFHITKKTSDQSNLKKVFELYQEMINFNFFCIENYLEPGKFKNVVTIACIFKEFEWANTFIQNHENIIEPSVRASVVHFNRGALNFYKGNLDLAQQHLIQVESVNIFYDLDSKSLLARIYYEQEEYFALTRFIVSFKDYIRKNSKLSKARKESYLNYLKILKQLIRVKQLAMRSKYKEDLLQKTNVLNRAVYKNWLLDKINEL